MPNVIKMDFQPNYSAGVGMSMPMVRVIYDNGTSQMMTPGAAGYKPSYNSVGALSWQPPDGFNVDGSKSGGEIANPYGADYPANAPPGMTPGQLAAWKNSVANGAGKDVGDGGSVGGNSSGGGGVSVGSGGAPSGYGRTTTNNRQTTTQTGSDTINRLDPNSQAALDKLIQDMQGGGTPYMLDQKAARQGEIGNVGGLRAGYTKDAAFADAQMAMQGQIRKTLEHLMPSINRAAEGAGTSRNSMRALLVQDAATRAAEAAGALGLKAASDYGQVGAQYSSVLAKLTEADDPAVQALLGALNVAKGANEIRNTSSTSTTTGLQTVDSPLSSGGSGGSYSRPGAGIVTGGGLLNPAPSVSPPLPGGINAGPGNADWSMGISSPGQNPNKPPSNDSGAGLWQTPLPGQPPNNNFWGGADEKERF